jgi:hypothetical protein
VLVLQALVGALTPTTGDAASAVGAMGQFRHLGYLLRLRLDVGMADIYVFPLLYVLFLLYLANRPLTRRDPSWSTLSRWFLVAMAIFFATCNFHPQYLAWITPFIVLQAADDRRVVWLHAVQVVSFYFYALPFGEHVLGGLFRPWPSLGVLGNPQPALTRFFTLEQIANMGRTLLSATLLFMIYLVHRAEKQREASA